MDQRNPPELHRRPHESAAARDSPWRRKPDESPLGSSMVTHWNPSGRHLPCIKVDVWAKFQGCEVFLNDLYHQEPFPKMRGKLSNYNLQELFNERHGETHLCMDKKNKKSRDKTTYQWINIPIFAMITCKSSDLWEFVSKS